MQRLPPICLILILPFLHLSVCAQGFMMSSAGMLPGTSSNSMPISFKSISNCINVESGIMTYASTKGFGVFLIDCEIKHHFNCMGLRLYPNPVKNTTTLKFMHPPAFSEIFKISVWDINGTMIFTRKESGYNIFSGVLLNLTNFSSGDYVLQVEGAAYLDAIKFIKIN